MEAAKDDIGLSQRRECGGTGKGVTQGESESKGPGVHDMFIEQQAVRGTREQGTWCE